MSKSGSPDALSLVLPSLVCGAAVAEPVSVQCARLIACAAAAADTDHTLLARCSRALVYMYCEVAFGSLSQAAKRRAAMLCPADNWHAY